ncbi:MAG: hypothetical protein ACW99A_18280 [Candidatus Kariarchaeaceae archaeon]|jgi:hypothetical protein
MSDAWGWLMDNAFGIILAMAIIVVIVMFWAIAFHPEITGGIVSGFLGTINTIAQYFGI